MGTSITAVIIAKNSAATIHQCIAALRFCDQILVGENNSTDNTLELARKAGAKVRSVAWEGYGKTKNRLIDEIDSGWILSIDADEVVTPELAGEIRQIAEQADVQDAYFIGRRNYFLGKVIAHCGWQPDWQLRFFRAKSARFEEKHVHEALVTEKGKGYFKQPLDHYSYATIEDYFKRLNHYTNLAAQDRFERGKRVFGLRMVFDPPWTFVKMYFIKQGWRDGFAGLVLCVFSALNTLVKHAKHWELARK
ncbi:glycosyltransferase family 2 protein [bacterium]|nr:glycosyltransferase family 2 protein [bacterium]